MPKVPLLTSEKTAGAVLNAALPATLDDARAQGQAISRALRRAAREARAPVKIISGGSGVRGRKGDRAFRLGIIASFVAFVIAPLLAASVYWGLIASKQYSTETKFAVRAGQGSPLDALGGMFGLAASQQSQDTHIIADYIRSRAMVESLARSLDLRKIFAREDVDYFSRFSRSDTVEDLEKYWRKMVDVKIDATSGIISVGVRAFSPEESLDLGQKIVDLSEALVNDMSTRSRRDALAQAHRELDRAETRLKTATNAMREARDAEGVLDASAAAEGLNKVIVSLKLELTRLEQDLASQGAAGRESPQARVIQSRMSAVKAQIEKYSQQVAGLDGGAGGTMAARLGYLSPRQVEVDLARQLYAQAAATYESARVDLETQHAYLVTSMRPTLAERSTYPRRWWEWSIIVFPAFFIWAALTAVAFLVRDNMAK